MVKIMNIFNPKKILCPIDFSDLSSLALKYAATAAVEFNAALTVFHAEFFDVPRYFSRHEDDQLIQEVKKAGATVEKELRDHTEKILGTFLGKVSVDYGAADRHPVEAILDVAEKESFDLIVMGTHGYSGLKQLFLGSVTENVIRNARVPVFTIRQKSHGFIDANQAGLLPVIERMLCSCRPSETAVSSLKNSRLHCRTISGATDGPVLRGRKRKQGFLHSGKRKFRVVGFKKHRVPNILSTLLFVKEVPLNALFQPRARKKAT